MDQTTTTGAEFRAHDFGEIAPEGRAFYDLRSLARELGLSEPGLRRLCARGEIPGARRIGGRWVVCRRVLEESFRGSPAATPPPPAFVPSASGSRSPTHSDLNRMFTSGNIWDAKGGGR